MIPISIQIGMVIISVEETLDRAGKKLPERI